MLRKTLTLLPRTRRPFSSSSSSPKPLTHLQRSSFESLDTDQAWKLFRSFAASSSLPDKPLLNSLITHLSSSLHLDNTTTPPLRHRLKRAFVSAAYVIEKDPTLLESDTLLTLFQSMKLAKAASPALALIKCMFKNRFFVPFHLWGSLIIDTCRETGTLVPFLKLFNESCRVAVDEKLDYMKPNLEACNAALEACCLHLESLPDAESVIELMSVIGVKPDESTFGFLGYLYAIKGLKEKIKEIESLMDGNKRVLYSNLISGYVKIGDLDSVSDVILQSLCSFSEETYCEIVKGFIESKKVKSLATLIIEAHKLEESLCTTESDKSVGFGIVNACVDLGFSGKSILDEMDAQGGCGGIGVYVPILKAYCKENRTSEATQLVTEISSSGVVQLDVETYEALIEASMTKQDFVSALALFRDMREMTRVSDLKGSYLTIMTGLLESQRPELMAKFVEEVLEDTRVEVKSHDWNSIIHAFCKSKRVEDAKRTFRRMVFLRYEPNQQTYLSLIGGYVSCGRYFEVVVLWKEFKEEGRTKLDHGLADAFLNALVKGGFFGTAMQVVEKCREMKIFVDKWRYKAVFMEALKKVRLPKLRKRKMKKIEFLDAFKNWVGITT
ncbi:Pentatricopeptide repeat-containing protein [Raphanus sativus]|uniref:Pentatricopeptide repeat-containing protein At1g68980, mitochondrial n=1 Tax=Raphanus sativus TaxID=3726 RepID=A0A6J0LXA6_RAPSA|nr:pentatricopeptide repeat-containing protein At1g68980, mitochondrial [Raphanus sativus]KAJ4909696.1 Pentatricopeptide repeat-containing protein [Raphanus sativus]